MKTILDKNLLEDLYSKGISYKEIAEITGYSKNTVNGYLWRTKGKMKDPWKFKRNQIEISQEQKEILFGTLMGDGYVQRQCNHSYLGRINHCIAQKNYCEYLSDKLENLTSPVKDYFNKAKNGKTYHHCYFSLKNNYRLKEFYDLFYKNGKKDIPEDLSLLTPKAMAFWFMDDGYSSSKCTIGIATCSFSFEGLLRLKKYLFSKYGITVNITKEFKLYFPAESGRKFYSLVKDYIIPEMQYKFKDICVSKIL